MLIFKINTGDCSIAMQPENEKVKVRNAKACWFLVALLESHSAKKSLKVEDLEAAWARKKLGRVPTRTDILRMLDALAEAWAQLAEILGAPAVASIQFAPRHATTGPWHLRLSEGIEFEHVDDQTFSEHAAGRPEIRIGLSAVECPAVWAEVGQWLAQADGLLSEGMYAECLELLDNAPALPISELAHLMCLFRKSRALRRLGRFTDAAQALSEIGSATSSKASASDMDWRMRAFIRTQLSLLSMRNSWDLAPHELSTSANFDRLRDSVDTAPNPAVQWEWCNLRALALRRDLDELASKDDSRAECMQLAKQIRAFYCAAYTWAVLAHDMYAAQAIAINFAYNLQLHIENCWLGDGESMDFSPSIAWYALAHRIVDLFNLPQDSAWDYIMLGELFLGHPDARIQVIGDAASWPESQSPANLKFYERSIELAEKFGGFRQKIGACNQMVQFLKLLSATSSEQLNSKLSAVERAERIAALRQHMQQLMQADSSAAADAIQAGFSMQ